MAKILITGVGEFDVPNDRVQEIVNVITRINGVRTQSVQESINIEKQKTVYGGLDLLNE